MKKAATLLLSGLVLLGLTACEANEETIKKEAHLIKVCRDNGGDPYIPLIGGVRCDMTPATKD